MNSTPTRTTESSMTAERGFSLIEVMISAVILFIMVGVSVEVIRSGNDMLASQSVKGELELKAQEYARKVTERIRNGLLVYEESGVADIPGVLDGSGYDVAIADGASATDGLEIRLFGDYTGVVNPGGTVRFTMTNNNGGESNRTNRIDDDNDGLIDEGTLVMELWDGDNTGAVVQTSIIGTNLGPLWTDAGVRDGLVQAAELSGTGFNVTRDGDRLTITITLQRIDRTLLRGDLGSGDAQPIINFQGVATVTLRN